MTEYKKKEKELEDEILGFVKALTIEEAGGNTKK